MSLVTAFINGLYTDLIIYITHILDINPKLYCHYRCTYVLRTQLLGPNSVRLRLILSYSGSEAGLCRVRWGRTSVLGGDQGLGRHWRLAPPPALEPGQPSVLPIPRYWLQHATRKEGQSNLIHDGFLLVRNVGLLLEWKSFFNLLNQLIYLLL